MSSRSCISGRLSPSLTKILISSFYLVSTDYCFSYLTFCFICASNNPFLPDYPDLNEEISVDSSNDPLSF